jgi:phosphoesterase RecJ-like protein
MIQAQPPMKKMQEIQNIQKTFADEKNKNFLILFHANPDGDAIGSALALKFLLEKNYKKTVSIYSKDAVPDKYKFLPNSASIQHNENLPEADVTIVMEAGNIERTGYSRETLVTKFLINIDHHQTNDFYADINWVEATRSAVSEMVYLLYKNLDGPKTIDKDPAMCLYVGILTDTGRFQYSNMTPNIYEIIKELVEAGVDVNFVYKNIYGRKSKSHIGFMKNLFNNLEFYSDDQLAVSFVDADVVEKLNVSVDDMDGACDFLRDIENVEVAVFIKQKKAGVYKFSLRSKGKIELDKLCKFFDGGGHKFAAGFEIKADNILSAKKIALPKIIENF